MRARAYNKRIEIAEFQSLIEKVDNTNDAIKDSLTTWANVKSLSGYRLEQYGLLEFKNPLQFTIRNREGLEITEKKGILYGGKIYVIQRYQPIDKDIQIIGVEYEG